MGDDDDVICLSSDDESSQKFVQQTKSTGSKMVLKKEDEYTDVCNLKRKSSDNTVALSTESLKKMRLDNGDKGKVAIANREKNISDGPVKVVTVGEVLISRVVQKDAMEKSTKVKDHCSISKASSGSSNGLNGKNVDTGKSDNLEENSKNSNTIEAIESVESVEMTERKSREISDVPMIGREDSKLDTIIEKNKAVVDIIDNEMEIHVPSTSGENADNIDEKTPCLVVINKEPVYHQEYHESFSMFLSLCLQTDRCSDMEKIVERLKRHYGQMDPAYAASQDFQDSLKVKRQLIAEKGRKMVYHYVNMLKTDMKGKKKSSVNDPVPAVDDTENIEEEPNNEDDEETRRHRQKIKRIEKAMKQCQKMITKYEEAEVDFDDENNSHYIKLDRFKERMVELYNQLCKYTKERPDAGRAYLRPKNLRVTQIPSIDQAINSFINSKLSINNKSNAKNKTCVDGLIFPDYIDILDCVEKVNGETNLNLDKRATQKLAEKAFTEMGKHLQEARQNDYWDTFALNLDNIDPASVDPALSEKLLENKKIADANVKKVFEEFVRKQEEGNDDSPSEDEDEEDEEDAEEDDDGNGDDDDDDNAEDRCSGDEDASNREGENDKIIDNESNIEKANDKSIDEESNVEKANDKRIDEESNVEKTNGMTKRIDEKLEEIDEAPSNEDGKNTVNDEVEDISSVDASHVLRSNISEGKEAVESMEVPCLDLDSNTEDAKEEESSPIVSHRPLRIRSFAKPPESWQCSQESDRGKKSPADETVTVEKMETTDDEISVLSSYIPKRNGVTKGVIALNGKTKRLIVASNNNHNRIPAPNVVHSTSSTANGRVESVLPNVPQRVNGVAAAGSISTGIQGLKIVKLPLSRVQNNVQRTTKVSLESERTRTVKEKVSENKYHKVGAPVRSNLNSNQPTEVRFRVPPTTSTPVQSTRSPPAKIPVLLPSREQNNPVKVLRMSDGKYVVSSNAARSPKSQRYITVAATSTPIQSSAQRNPIRNPISNTQRSHLEAARRVTPIQLSSTHQRSMQVLRLNNGKTYPIEAVQHARSIGPKVTGTRNTNSNQFT